MVGGFLGRKAVEEERDYAVARHRQVQKNDEKMRRMIEELKKLREEGIPICVDVATKCTHCGRYISGRYWTRLFLDKPKDDEFHPKRNTTKVWKCPSCKEEFIRAVVWQESEEEFKLRLGH